MAARLARGPDGREWVIRERWFPPVRGLPADPDVDAFDPGATATPAFFLFDLVMSLVGLAFYAARLLIGVPALLFQALFMPPWIEAIHEGPPYSKMTWRAADRQVGPRVFDQIAAAIERGDRRIQVEGATFLGFASRP